MSAEPRLYGLPGAEVLYFDPAGVYEAEIEPAVGTAEDGGDWPPIPLQWTIEEWSVTPPREHLPSTDYLVEWVTEWAGENGMLTDGVMELETLAKDPAVLGMAEALLTVMASKLGGRMADRHLGDHVIAWDEKGEPLYDGQPLYRGRTR